MESSSNLLPEKPIEPLDSECCGTGCTPCVFDIYKKQLSKWENDCQEILRNGATNQSSPESNITPYQYKDFELVNIIEDPVNENVKIFSFNCAPKGSSAFSPFPVDIGQHVVLKIGFVSRKYTVLRVNKNSTFDILVKIYPDGPMTQLISKLTVGESVQIRGPFGDILHYKANTFKNVIMLAAGTGIAPMYRIIQHILDNEEDETKIKMIFSSKHLKDVFLSKELKEWSNFWNFDVIHYLSSEAGETKVPYGMKVVFSKVNFECLREMIELQFKNSKALYYICGTKSFEKDMVNYLSKLNVDNKDVHVF